MSAADHALPGGRFAAEGLCQSCGLPWPCPTYLAHQENSVPLDRTTEQILATHEPYQLTENDFRPIEPEVCGLAITTWGEDGGFVGWGHIPAAEMVEAVNRLDEHWGVFDPDWPWQEHHVEHDHVFGYVISGEPAWRTCPPDQPGAVAVTIALPR